MDARRTTRFPPGPGWIRPPRCWQVGLDRRRLRPGPQRGGRSGLERLDLVGLDLVGVHLERLDLVGRDVAGEEVVVT